MNLESIHPERRSRGVTLLELMLALAVTAMVGLGVGAMLAMISSSTSSAREARSLLLRAHAGQIRLRSYIDSSLSLLQHDPDKGLVIWLTDQRTIGSVNLSEIRIFWFDEEEQTLSVEWINFPEEWTELQVQTFDVVVPGGSDYFTIFDTQRAGGMTATLELVEDVDSVAFTFDDPTITDATRVTMAMGLVMDDDEEVKQTLATFGLADHE